MKLLVPTDFSDLSKVAVSYAVNMAKHLESEVILLNVVFINGVPGAVANFQMSKIEAMMIEEAEKEFETLIKDIKELHKGFGFISSHTITGYPIEDVIESFAKSAEIDLIIMGTKGATGLKKLLVGSNTAATIANSSIPVLSIPAQAPYNGIKNILYPTDMVNLREEIELIVPMAYVFSATLHVLHIANPSDNDITDHKNLADEIISHNLYDKIEFHQMTNANIVDGIEEDIHLTNADILVTFTHKSTFFEKLFGQSVTRELNMAPVVPILSFKR